MAWPTPPPWNQLFDARIGLPTVHRARIAVAIQNLLGVADALLHGPDKLRGWGTGTPPNPIFLHVSGFDPRTQAYRHSVNEHFGRPAHSDLAVVAPYRITLEVSISLGKSTAEQQVDRWLAPPHGKRLSVEQLKGRLAETVPSVFTLILEQADSLILTPQQISLLQAGGARLRERLDSLWDTTAQHLEVLPPDFSPGTAMEIVEKATAAAWQNTRQDREATKAILSPIQLNLTPDLVRRVLLTDEPISDRIFIS